jgi:uncharacterized protein YbaP (TraB family)
MRGLRNIGMAAASAGLACAFAAHALHAHAIESMPAIGNPPAQPAPMPAPGVPGALAGQDARHGVLYRVSRGKGVAYLFGTVHVGQPGMSVLGDRTMQAFARSHTLVLEVDLRDRAALVAAVAGHGMYADGDTLDRHLSAGAMAALRQTLGRLGMRFDEIAKMKPWMAANLLIAAELGGKGYASGMGTEASLLELAGASKPVAALESADEQFALFERLSESDQERYLVETLRESDSGKALDRAERLLAAWRAADGTALERIMQEALAEDTVTARFLKSTLLGARNVGMASRLEALLAADSSLFVAVGALHLVGDNGLPVLLQRRGYAVRRID